MTTSYKIFPMRFDTAKWTALMNTIEAAEVGDFARMFGIATGTVVCWRTGNYHKDAPFPSMTNFTNICNWMDVNPQDFFCLDESESK